MTPGAINMTIQIQKRFLVRIPPDVRKELGLKEGDHLEARVEGGRLVLVPMKTLPADQAWFWTEEWQKGEREADEDIRLGRVIKCKSVNDLVRELER
ncbi:MAG: AbrB/MazE/SpoVT family DNA-binding domain-containing protein [Firmicutes bacterium]|nr:AbrB/MazE/SpoVT family DNA-binding domain-containing protein [Bacillota bacterium]